jgi:hypothetical protein
MKSIKYFRLKYIILPVLIAIVSYFYLLKYRDIKEFFDT